MALTRPAQPRGPDGRFACVPSFPRLRTSPCGCGGGGVHPCPIGRRLAPVRRAAVQRYRAPAYTPADLEDVERELYGVEAEWDALAPALDSVRAQLRAASGSAARYHRAQGATHERPMHSRGRGYTLVGGSSEQGYEDLLDERRQLLAHQEHLRRERRRLEHDRNRVLAVLRRTGQTQALGYARRRSRMTRAERNRWRR